MFVTLARTPEAGTSTKGNRIQMATQSKTKASSNGAKTAKATPRGQQARSVAETVVDLPVGVVLGATDRITDLVEPFTDRSGADKQLKAYRTRLRRTVKRTERRGATARRKAAAEARKRQRSIETAVKRNRNEVEQRVRKTIEAQTSRAQDLVDHLRV
jgi:Holliday junction resolvasome RuvABC ATP-dependent DNA helicase subunit